MSARLTRSKPSTAGDRSRERILEAAEELIRRFGPSKVRIVDVAGALEMSHGNVYRYFTNKEAVLDAVAERWLKEVSSPLRAILAGKQSAAWRLEQWLITLVRLKHRKAKEDPELFQTYHGIAEASHNVVSEHLSDLTAQLAEIIRSGSEAGQWSVKDCRAAAELVLRSTAFFHHPLLVREYEQRTAERMARQTLKVLVAGFKAGAI